MTLKPAMIFCQWKEIFIYRHHVEPRVQFHVPKEETFPIPKKHIDVTRKDYGTRIWVCCLECLRGLKFVSCMDKIHEVLNVYAKNFPKYIVVRRAGYKKSITARLDHLWLEICPSCRKQLRKRRSMNGRLKNQSSIMLEDREAFLVSIRKMESTKKPLTTQGKVGDADGGRPCKRSEKSRETDDENKGSNKSHI